MKPGSRIALNEEKISELSVARENLEKTAKDMEMSLNEQLNSNKSTLENEISETKSELQKEIKDQISQIPASQADNWAASWDDEHTLTFIILGNRGRKMKRKIVVCGIFMTTVFMLGWPANESFANNGYTSGNGPIENHMVSMKILQGKDGKWQPDCN